MRKHLYFFTRIILQLDFSSRTRGWDPVTGETCTLSGAVLSN